MNSLRGYSARKSYKRKGYIYFMNRKLRAHGHCAFLLPSFFSDAYALAEINAGFSTENLVLLPRDERKSIMLIEKYINNCCDNAIGRQYWLSYDMNGMFM
jgi:hypothetical protein